MKKIKVLVISETESIINEISIHLKKMKLKFDVMEYDLSSVELIKNGNYNFVLLDLSEKNQIGFEICRLVKSKYLPEFIPLIFLVNYLDIETRLSGLKFGADDFVFLPYYLEELKKRMFNQIRIKKHRDELINNKVFFETILKCLPVGLLVEDKNMQKILFSNDVLKEIFSDENGVELENTIPENLSNQLKKVFHELQYSDQKGSSKNLIYKIEGTSKSIRTKNTFILDKEGDHCYNLSIFEDISKLEQANIKLEKLANYDTLTGVSNRRHINHFLEAEVNRFERFQQKFSVLIIDIDDFKKFNDTYGHYCGDYVLREMAGLFQESIRKVDKLARWGGEEFLFLLPATDIEGCFEISEKIRKNIEQHVFQYNEANMAITISIGGSIYRNVDSKIEDIIEEADQALYKAKANGKNCSQVFNYNKKKPLE